MLRAIWAGSAGNRGHQYVARTTWYSACFGMEGMMFARLGDSALTALIHDPSLDAVGDTFEAAVLEPARRAALEFHEDGTVVAE